MIKDRFNMINLPLHEIVWINSSTCKLKYCTEYLAKSVLDALAAEPEALKVKVD
jgi:hypothetical protein